MHTRYNPRRWILGALVVVVAALAALGPGDGTSAANGGRRPRPDYASKEAFRLECELLGGTYSEGIDGIGCYLAGVGSVHCDGNGKNCEYTPASWQSPAGGAGSYDGGIDQVATDGGPQSPGPKGTNSAAAAAPGVAAADDDREPKATAKPAKGKTEKHGKKHGRDGKGRKP